MARVAWAGLAALAILLHLAPSKGEATSIHWVFRDVGEILVWVETNEDRPEDGLIDAAMMQADLARLLTGMFEDSRPDLSIRQHRSPGRYFSPLIELERGTLAVILKVTVRRGPAGSGLPRCLGAVAVHLERDAPKYGFDEDAYRLDFAPEPFVSRCDAAAVSVGALKAAEPNLTLTADVLGRLPPPYEPPPEERQRRKR